MVLKNIINKNNIYKKKIMPEKPKILVMNPPSFDKFQYIKEGRCESRKGAQLTQPVTLGIISALLSRHGYSNTIRDFMAEPISINGLISLVKKYDIIVMSISSPTFEFDKKTAEIIKQHNKSSILVSFGVISTALPELVLKSNFDIAIINEPEYAVLDIVKNYKLNKSKSAAHKIKNIDSIKGIAYKKGNKVIKTKKRPFIENLDEIPFPDRSKMPIHKYINPKTGRPFTVIKVQRGCPYSCSFCTAPFYYGKKPRYRSPKSVLGEIKECVNKYNISDFLFLADTFTINHAYVKELCKKIIESNLKITWSCNSRIDTFNYEIAKLMKRAGCWLISFGVESGSKKIISESLKSLDPENAIKAANICRKAGIKSIMYYILGFPNETKDDMIKTIKLSLKVKSDFARFFVATPLPGSRLYNISRNKSFFSLNLSDPRASLSNVSDKELKNIIRKAYIKFYLRPSQIYKVLDSYSFKNFTQLIKTILNYLRSYLA